MATYFIGSEFDSMNPVSTDSIRESGYGYVDENMRGGVEVWRNAAIDIIPRDFETTGAPVALSNLWLHYRGRLSPYADRNNYVQFFNTADVAVVRIETMRNSQNGDMFARVAYWNGTAWTPMGDWFSWKNDMMTVDIHIKIGSAGKIEFFHDGLTIISQTLDTSLLGNITRIRLGPANYDYGNTCYSEVLLASYSTLGHRVRHRYPTANGTYTDWTGDWTALDEFQENVDTDAVSTDQIGNRETFTGRTFSTTGMPVKAVAVAARSRVDPESTVKGIKPMLVVNGNDYVAPASLPVTPGISAGEWVFNKNPQTNGEWTLAQVNSVEFGVKASD